MAKVYAVWEGDYEDRTVMGLYSTLEGAQSAHRHQAGWEDIPGYGWACSWNVPAIPPDPNYELVFTTGSVAVLGGVATLPDGRTIRTEAKYVDYPIASSTVDSVRLLGVPAQSCSASIEVFALHP